MAQQRSKGTLSAGHNLEKENCDSSELHLHPLQINDELPVDEVIFINPLTPPLPSLAILKPEQLVMTESERAREHGVLISDTSSDPIIKGVNEDPLWVSEAVSTQSARIQTHECSLCDKVFGTASALNKHLLSHQQDRPHICPICQRAFKRHDHLNGHMLTHQKRKPVRCLEPGCRKSYCDGYALKRHCASQHRIFLVPPPLISAQIQSATGTWGDFFPCFGGQGGRNDYHSIFFTPPKPVSKPQHKCSDYAGLTGFASYPGASTSGLGASSVQESVAPQAQSHLVLDSWEQGESKDLYGEAAGEPHASQLMSITPQWVSSLEREVSPIAARSPGSRMGSRGLHCWESGLDFPVSELQTLEEMLSLQPTRETWSSGEAAPFETPTTSTMRRPAIVISQANPKGRAQQQHRPDSSASTRSSVGTPAAGNNAALSQPSPDRTPKLPWQRGGEVRKKKARKRKVKETDLPAPSFLPPHRTLVAAPRRQRQRPLYHASPSQVAMASFSTDSTSQPSEGGTRAVISIAGNGRKTVDRGDHGPPPSKSSCRQACGLTGPGEPLVKVERPSLWKIVTQGEKGDEDVGQCQEALEVSCFVGQMPLSPLVIPVSVPVSEKTEVAPGDIDGEPAINLAPLAAERLQGSTGASKRAHRFEFLKTLVIPLPTPPLVSPVPVLEEGGVGGQWCRAAGGYPSQLRSPVYLADHLLNPSFQPPSYTPPPMLSPLRPGTGLYFSTLLPPHPGPPTLSTYTAMLDVADGISLVMDDTVVTIEPRINVGSRFQAEIPPLRNLLLMLYEEHPAQLVWAPWGDLATNPRTQQRVTEFLDLCCSSVLPGGGANTELALHCLHEVQGDFLAALDLLLIRGDYYACAQNTMDYHYSGSDHWTSREKRLFRRALLTHNKDFLLLHSMLQSKSVAQCVEYYYAMKKMKKFKQRSRAPESKEEDGANSILDSPCVSETPLLGRAVTRKRLAIQREVQRGPTATPSALAYPCEECGRSFEKVKSRSAHMKTHRHHEREWPARDRCSSVLLGEEHKQEEAGLVTGSGIKWRSVHF